MSKHYIESKGLHLNYRIITDMIDSGASVLDVGCGDGTLMKMLQDRGALVSGIDINQDNIIKCLEKGLSVIQGDIDEGLQEYPDGSYDYVIFKSNSSIYRKTRFCYSRNVENWKEGCDKFS